MIALMLLLAVAQELPDSRDRQFLKHSEVPTSLNESLPGAPRRSEFPRTGSVTVESPVPPDTGPGRQLPPATPEIRNCTNAGPEQFLGDVVFIEDFESYDAKRWDDFGAAPEAIEIVDGGRRGKCVQITATLGKNTGAHLYKMLEPGLDTCHLRFSVKFDKEHDYIHHFVHLAGYNPATRWAQGGAGDRPEGDKRFSTGIEPWGDWGKHPAPGAWHFYSYWCEMKKSPDGKYWGNGFAPKTPALVERDKWIDVEIMLKCNSAPDQADGEQALWIDGKEAGRWGGIRWRTDPKLKVNGLWMLYYITENAGRQNGVKEPRKVNRVRFDDIAVSKSYIGPPKK